jgi:hypothetical protein
MGIVVELLESRLDWPWYLLAACPLQAEVGETERQVYTAQMLVLARIADVD